MEILDKNYLTIKDLMELMNTGRPAARKIMEQAIATAIDRNYLLPQTNKLIAPTNIVRELLQI